MASDAIAVLARLAEILEALGLPYVIGGSVASSTWGEPRSTHDVDLILRLPAERAQELVRAVQTEFYVDEGEVVRATREARAFNLIHLRLFQKIDVFVAGTSALDMAQLEHPVARGLGAEPERSFPVTAPEVLVLRKLDWYPRGGRVSERQWRDVLAILRVQCATLDREWMSSLAAATELEPLLAEALAAAWGDEGAG